MSNRKRSLHVLRAHRENLVAASDFQAFKEAQLKYLDWLLLDMEFEEEQDDNAAAFIETSSGGRWECATMTQAREDENASSS